jgi:hypothetical protein
LSNAVWHCGMARASQSRGDVLLAEASGNAMVL